MIRLLPIEEDARCGYQQLTMTITTMLLDDDDVIEWIDDIVVNDELTYHTQWCGTDVCYQRALTAITSRQ